MKNIVLLFILCFASISLAAFYPIFDRDRGPWSRLINFDKEITVKSETMFGLTHPIFGKESINFRLDVIDGDVFFDIPVVDNMIIYRIEDSIYIQGFYNDPGNPFNNMGMYGYGNIDVYDTYEHVGSFMVVPEPSTVILLSFGAIGILRCKN